MVKYIRWFLYVIIGTLAVSLFVAGEMMHDVWEYGNDRIPNWLNAIIDFMKRK
jgi:hypothetical protein